MGEPDWIDFIYLLEGQDQRPRAIRDTDPPRPSYLIDCCLRSSVQHSQLPPNADTTPFPRQVFLGSIHDSRAPVADDLTYRCCTTSRTAAKGGDLTMRPATDNRKY